MRTIRTKTRTEWIKAVLGRKGRFTEKKIEKVFRRLAFDGWFSAMPAFGPPRERVAMVHASSVFAKIVQAVGAGQREFSIADLNCRIGMPVGCLAGCHALGRAGLAMVSADGDQITLLPFSPPGAEMINASRCHRFAKGYKAKNVIEAILPVLDPHRSRANVTVPRRLQAAVLLEQLHICADDLLDDDFDCNRRIKLMSTWMFATPTGRADFEAA